MQSRLIKYSDWFWSRKVNLCIPIVQEKVTHLYNKAVLEPLFLPVFAIKYFGNDCNIGFDFIPVMVICTNLTRIIMFKSQKYITDPQLLTISQEHLAKRPITLNDP